MQRRTAAMLAYARRETVCWLVGHRWRFLGRWLGPGEGYEYYREDGMKYRCDRCKTKAADYHPGDAPWWLQVRRAIGRFFASLRSAWSCYEKRDGQWYVGGPWWVVAAGRFIGAPLFALGQAWACAIWFLPRWPAAWFLEAYDRFSSWEMTRTDSYSWVTPDGPPPATTGDGSAPPWEPVGMHWNREKQGQPPTVWARSAEAYLPPENASPGTFGVGSWTEYYWDAR